MSHDIIADTSRKLGLEPHVLFKNAYEEVGRLAEGRRKLTEYSDRGVIGEFMVDYCLDHWRKHAVEHSA